MKEAIVSHEEDNAIVKLNKEIEDEILKNVVEKEGYKVLSVE